jgi:hypothetical protein
MENSLPVASMRPPLPSGIGSVNVPRMTPITAVHSSFAAAWGAYPGIRCVHEHRVHIPDVEDLKAVGEMTVLGSGRTSQDLGIIRGKEAPSVNLPPNAWSTGSTIDIGSPSDLHSISGAAITVITASPQFAGGASPNARSYR